MEKIAELQHDLLVAEYTITVSLNKNKRPGGRCIEELDYELQVDTGALHPLAAGEKPYQWQQRHSLAAKEAAAEVLEPLRVAYVEEEMSYV